MQTNLRVSIIKLALKRDQEQTNYWLYLNNVKLVDVMSVFIYKTTELNVGIDAI